MTKLIESVETAAAARAGLRLHRRLGPPGRVGPQHRLVEAHRRGRARGRRALRARGQVGPQGRAHGVPHHRARGAHRASCSSARAPASGPRMSSPSPRRPPARASTTRPRSSSAGCWAWSSHCWDVASMASAKGVVEGMKRELDALAAAPPTPARSDVTADASPMDPRDIIDGLLELTIVGSFSRPGYVIRRRLFGWADPDPRALAGRTALVTGPTSGLGRAAAEAVAALGARVILVGRSEERLGARARRARGPPWRGPLPDRGRRHVLARERACGGRAHRRDRGAPRRHRRQRRRHPRAAHRDGRWPGGHVRHHGGRAVRAHRRTAAAARGQW